MRRRSLIPLVCACLGFCACAGEDNGNGRSDNGFRAFLAPEPAARPELAGPGVTGPVSKTGPGSPKAPDLTAGVPALPAGCDAQRCRVRAISPELAAFLAKEPDRLLSFEPGVTASDLATLLLFPGVRRLELSHVVRPDLTLVSGAALTELRLGRTGLTDLAPLRAFPRLTHLVLFEAPFIDASPLAGLKELEVLDLSRCPNVRDFGFLPNLTHLRSLLLSGTAFSDPALLAGLTGLRELGLGHTQLAMSGVDALAPLTGLSGLHLDGLAGLTDLSALAGFTGLRHLGLSDTGARDLKPLAGLAELRTLKLTRTPVTSLVSLAGLRHLHSLYIERTKVVDLSPLRGLAGLRWLHVSNTPVANLAPLAGLGLTTLNLAGTKVRQLGPLRGCRQLEFLFLAGTAVSDLSPLTGLPLRLLDLTRTKVVTLTPLAQVPTLATLSLAHTPVKDLSPLVGLPKFEALDLGEVTLARPEQVLELSHLKTLIFTERLLPPAVRQALLARGVELVPVP